MRQIFLLLTLALLIAVLLAVIGPSLPEGNPLRTAGNGMREIGSFLSKGFGGGYGQVAPGG